MAIKVPDTELKPDEANAHPNKRFFVEMLTRDIELQDAILDLLDNCVDGIIRENEFKPGPKPYEGYYASIAASPSEFQIDDNCGGIPPDLAKHYAFSLGRHEAIDVAERNRPTVGTYGIGMKRAIFKIGRHATVISQHRDAAFEVTISKEWLQDDDNWKLPFKRMDPPYEESGTLITITTLRDPVRNAFSRQSRFLPDLHSAISRIYSLLLRKGLEVQLNGHVIRPRRLLFMADLSSTKKAAGIAPYMFEGNISGVKTRIIVGLWRPIPDETELDDEQEMKRSRSDAGITVICNDRVVVDADTSRLTGWGEANVPSFHNQFMAIAGIVEFHCNDAWKLPVTTTKRGLDTGSEAYLIAKDYIREGIKKFTSFTNDWKKQPAERDALYGLSETVESSSLFGQTNARKMKGRWKNLRPKTDIENARQFVPSLPSPRKKETDDVQIRYKRKARDVQTVSEFLFGEKDEKPSDVGAKTFDYLLKRVK